MRPAPMRNATTLEASGAPWRETVEFVVEAVWHDTGITTVRLYPAGDTLDAGLETLGGALDLVRGVPPVVPG